MKNLGTVAFTAGHLLHIHTCIENYCVNHMYTTSVHMVVLSLSWMKVKQNCDRLRGVCKCDWVA